MADNSASMDNLRQSEPLLLKLSPDYCPECAWRLYPGSTSGKCSNMNCKNCHPALLETKDSGYSVKSVLEWGKPDKAVAIGYTTNLGRDIAIGVQAQAQESIAIGISQGPQKPPPLLLRLIRESDVGPYCSRCGSSFYRNKWFGRTDKCINPKCPNCHPNIKEKPVDISSPFSKVRQIPPRPEGDPPPQRPRGTRLISPWSGIQGISGIQGVSGIQGASGFSGFTGIIGGREVSLEPVALGGDGSARSWATDYGVDDYIRIKDSDKLWLVKAIQSEGVVVENDVATRLISFNNVITKEDISIPSRDDTVKTRKLVL